MNRLYGNKWVEFANYFGNRSSNDIKNHWYTLKPLTNFFMNKFQFKIVLYIEGRVECLSKSEIKILDSYLKRKRISSLTRKLIFNPKFNLYLQKHIFQEQRINSNGRSLNKPLNFSFKKLKTPKTSLEK